MPTNVDGIVGHHVLVVVESMLNVILLLLVTKKPLQKKEVEQNQRVKIPHLLNLALAVRVKKNVLKFTANTKLQLS